MNSETQIKNRVGVIELFRRTFNLYQQHIDLFWWVMLPIIVISLLIDFVMLYGFYHHFPNTSWIVGTNSGFSVKTFFASKDFIDFTFSYSSFVIILLWFTLCPLVLIAYQLFCGEVTSVSAVWQHTFRRIGSIIGVSLLLLCGILCALFSLLLLSTLLFSTQSHLFSLVIPFSFFIVILYFMVRLSLFNQGIMIENLSALNSLRRSSELVNGRWVGFFGRYLLLFWGSSVLTGLVFSTAFFVISYFSPEYIQIRNELQSEKFLFVLLGIDFKMQLGNMNVDIGSIENVLTEVPRFWTIGLILIIKVVLHAFFAPVWAILTTHLYLEQTGKDLDRIQV